jgi:hypothetical protein
MQGIPVEIKPYGDLKGRIMQTFPETSRKHLSYDAAVMLLAVLPDHIRDAYSAHAQQIGYSIELVLEMALADFLDPDSLTFTDCKPQIGLQPTSDLKTD